jgi:hypothetical protein
METLPALKTGKLVVILPPNREILPEAITELALAAPVTVLDGGNRFQAYRIAQLIRRHSPQAEEIANRIFLRRAFTCHQMLNLLENAPNAAHPHIVLDILCTFNDEQVKPGDASRLLQLCIHQLRRLAVSAPVAVSISSDLTEGRTFLLETLCKQADEIFSLQNNSLPEPEQIQLF